FKDLIPILRHYVQSRHIPDTPILFVSHNARVFDVPFLMNEFNRCSEEIPSDWQFLDTIPLARELLKSEEGKNLSGKSLQSLRQHYDVALDGEAHRAMSDVNTLAWVLQAMTHDLKLSVSSLLERSFKVSDIVNTKKKKKSTS
ncbi:exonuclease DPD1, chloroplastic/mitochondrial-like, partial [Thalictrum thalictroides]